MKVPKLSPSQLATVLGDTVSGDAVTTDPAPLNPLAGDSGAGEAIIGKTPWRAVNGPHGRKPGAIVRDFDGAYLFAAPPGIAHMAVTAVNTWTKLFGDCTVYRDVLRALQVQLIPLRAMPAIKRALELIEGTLHPKDDLQ